VWIEQGIIGFILLLILILTVLFTGERVYHHLKNPSDKIVVMAALLSFIVILSINLINDMIETDKVGPFYFLTMAIICSYAMKSYKQIDNQ
jgi:membrane protein CcdC involved in cytochrome C biogenesis